LTFHASTERFRTFTMTCPSMCPAKILSAFVASRYTSPNSDNIDYYPGTPLKEPVVLYGATSRYHDGRLGPHDWTLHPQHFYAKRAWLGFCLCPPVGVRDWHSALSELVPLPLVWVPSASTPGDGSLNPEFLSVFSKQAALLYAGMCTFRTPDPPTPLL